MLKRILTLAIYYSSLFLIWPIALFSQHTPDWRRIARGYYLNVDLVDYEAVDFKWDIKGISQAFMNEGLNNLSENKIEIAILNFDKVIESERRFWPAYYYRAICFKKTLQFSKAELDLLTVIKLNPFKGVYVELGEIYHIGKRFSDAKAEFQLALDIDPNFVNAHFALGNLYVTVGDMNKGLEEFDKCASINPKFAKGYFVKGVLKYTDTNRDDFMATSLLTKAIETDSTFTNAIFWRAIIFTETDQPQMALEDWDHLVRMDPENRFSLLMRAMLLTTFGQYDKAFNDYKKSFIAKNIFTYEYNGKQNINDVMEGMQATAGYLVRTGYGMDAKIFASLKEAFCQIMISRNGAALAVLNPIIQKQGSLPAYMLQAIALTRTNQLDAAIVSFSKALEYDNDIFVAHEKRAVYRYNEKDWKGASEDLADLRRLEPNSDVLLRFSGMLKSRTGDFNGSMTDLSRYLEKNKDLDAWETIAFCHSELGNHDAAVAIYRKLLSIEPNYRNAYDRIFEQMLLKGDSSQALKVLKEKQIKWPDDNMTTLKIADTYLNILQYDSAEIFLEKVFSKLDSFTRTARGDWTEMSEAHYLKSRGLFMRNRFAEALVSINSSIQYGPATANKVFLRMNIYLNQKILLRLQKIIKY